MGKQLLTKQDLAERWEFSITTINRYVDDGIVNPVKGLPSVRFNIEHIMKLEETEISKLSPLERKRLLKEIEQLKKEKEELQKQNEELKDFVRLTVGNGIKFVKEVI